MDVLITQRGIAVNPLRQDLVKALSDAKLPLKSIEELKDIAYSMVGTPDPLEFEDRVVAIMEARDGTVLDVVKQIKPIKL